MTNRYEAKPPRKPRWIQHVYAVLNGYFWLPCPLCGKYFGGHEWEHGATIPAGRSTRQAVCSECIPVAHERTVAYERSYGYQVLCPCHPLLDGEL